MSAKMHYLLSWVVPAAGGLVGFFVFAFAAYVSISNGLFERLLPASRIVGQRLEIGPAGGMMVLVILTFLLLLVFVSGSANLAGWAMNKCIHVQCSKCGERADRIYENWWSRYQKFGGPVVYLCRSCGHRENFRVYEGDTD
jgi:hypothetical protein